MIEIREIKELLKLCKIALRKNSIDQDCLTDKDKHNEAIFHDGITNTGAFDGCSQ